MTHTLHIERLTTLLAAAAAETPERSPACPDEHEVVAYVDGMLPVPACEDLERHAADCGHCLAVITLLSRAREVDPIGPALGVVATQPRSAASPKPPRRWRLAPQWAAAAALLVAVPVLLLLGRNLDGGDAGQGRPGPQATRSIATTTPDLRVLSPGAGAAVDPRQLRFQWTDIAGTPFYDVRIVTDEGDVVIEQRVTGTSWWPPAQLRLRPGAEYYMHVDAYPSGDKAASSGHVPFRVVE